VRILRSAPGTRVHAAAGLQGATLAKTDMSSRRLWGDLSNASPGATSLGDLRTRISVGPVWTARSLNGVNWTNATCSVMARRAPATAVPARAICVRVLAGAEEHVRAHRADRADRVARRLPRCFALGAVQPRVRTIPLEPMRALGAEDNLSRPPCARLGCPDARLVQWMRTIARTASGSATALASFKATTMRSATIKTDRKVGMRSTVGDRVGPCLRQSSPRKRLSPCPATTSAFADRVSGRRAQGRHRSSAGWRRQSVVVAATKGTWMTALRLAPATRAARTRVRISSSPGVFGALARARLHRTRSRVPIIRDSGRCARVLGTGGKITNQQGALHTVADQRGGFLLTPPLRSARGYAVAARSWLIGRGPGDRTVGLDRIAAAGSGLCLQRVCFLAAEISAGVEREQRRATRRQRRRVCSAGLRLLIVVLPDGVLIGVALLIRAIGCLARSSQRIQDRQMPPPVRGGFAGSEPRRPSFAR